MKRHPKTPSCPSCGSVMVYERRDDVLAYEGHTRTIKTLGFWCDNCGEAILTGKPLIASEKAYLALKAEVDATKRPEPSDANVPTGQRSVRTRKRHPIVERVGSKTKTTSILDAEAIAQIRKRLGLTQKEASQLLGVDNRAFRDYESGRFMMSVPMSNLLRLLDNDPKRLEELTGPELVKASRMGTATKTAKRPGTVVEVSPSRERAKVPNRPSAPVVRVRNTVRSTGTDS